MRNSIDYNKNPAILNDFLNYLLNTKNYSIGTVLGYEIDLNIFFKFILKYKDIPLTIKSITVFILMQINQDDILAFLVYINYYKNNCSITRKRKVAAIKTFFKWLYMYNPSVHKKNPTKEFPVIQQIKRMPKYLTLNQAKEIQNIFNAENCNQYIRNNTIITLFLNTGIRLSELINMNIEDIDFEEKKIKILAKGNKERYVYFSEYCKNKLLKYMEIRQSKKITENALFISTRNRRLSKSSIENICRQAYKLMGLNDKKYCVHTLRHTAATIYFEANGRDILLLKEILGHSSILSTQIYTHTYSNLTKEAVNKNPLSDYFINKVA